MTIRTFIADDETRSREVFAHWVRQDPNLRLVGEAEDGEGLIDQLRRSRAGLVFLDVEMPRLGGMQALRQIRAQGLNPFIVLVTAHERYAVQAFELKVGDYLLKPVGQARFTEAVSRARQALAQQASFQALEETQTPLMINQGDFMKPISPSSILWVEAASQYARVHTWDADYLLSRPLADVATELPTPPFLRIHRSALINLNCVCHVLRDRGNYQVQLGNGEQVPIARSRREVVLRRIRGVARS